MNWSIWTDCITKEYIIPNQRRDVYVLIPEFLQKKYGERIKEPFYQGYGEFGGYDIYNLVVDFNINMSIDEVLKLRGFQIIPPNAVTGLWENEKEEMRKRGISEATIMKMDAERREINYNNILKQRELIRSEFINYKLQDKIIGELPLRSVGIAMIGKEDDNNMLRFPVKITYDSKAVYEKCPASDTNINLSFVFSGDERKQMVI